MKLNLGLFILLAAVTSYVSGSDSDDEPPVDEHANDNGQEEPTRTRRCPGCKTTLNEHNFGAPSKHCGGPQQSRPEGAAAATGGARRRTNIDTPHRIPLDNPQVTFRENLHVMREQLESLLNEEENLRVAEQNELRQVEQEIAAAQERIARLQNRELPRLPNDGGEIPFNRLRQRDANERQHAGTERTLDESQNWRERLREDMSANRGNNRGGIDNLFAPPVVDEETRRRQIGEHHNINGINDYFNVETESEMFLRPRRTPTALHEKPLLVPDFVSSIVPQPEEHILSDGTSKGQTKLVISSGPKRPKLESITLNQWVIANTRIFFSLLDSGRLSSSREVRDYLAYTVRVMELYPKHDWVSILRLDQEFRILQATYNYPWSRDMAHLHEVFLSPRRPLSSRPNTSQGSQNNSSDGRRFATISLDGQVICRNYNTDRCTQGSNCRFAHVCNRLVNGRCCNQAHPGIRHPPSPGLTNQMGGTIS